MRHIISILVENKFGVLARIAGMFSGRGFNIETLNANEIIVEPGNSLWRIARKTMGGGIFYSEIYKNNLMRIKNPDLIYPGQVFNIPKIRKNISYE